MSTEYTAFPDFADTPMNKELRRQRAQMDQSPMTRVTLDKLPGAGARELAGDPFAQTPLPFCGRREAVWRLFDFIKIPTEIRWWAVTGPAGSGKSRLAFEVMRRLVPEYYSFFLDADADLSCAEEFVPFQNTLVVVDSFQGKEAAVARFISVFLDKFQDTIHFLRILFLERETPVPGNSWCDRLEAAFAPEYRSRFRSLEYDPGLASLGGHNFLRLGDLDDGTLTCLAGAVCARNDLPEDPHRDQQLKDCFLEKCGRLRYSPLLFCLFVETYGKDQCGETDQEMLLKWLLNREMERLEAVECGDADTNHGSQRTDGREHGNWPVSYDWDKQKAAQLWEKFPLAFQRSLAQLIQDFPCFETLRDFIRASSEDASNLYALEARLALLAGEVTGDGDISPQQRTVVETEYAFWKSCPEGEPRLQLAKLTGIYLCARWMTAWGLTAPGQECFDLLDHFPDSEEVTPCKVSFLLDLAAWYTDVAKNLKCSGQIVRQVRPLLDRIPDGGDKTRLLLRYYREQALGLIAQKRWKAALDLHQEFYPLVDWEDEIQVELYAYWAFCCTMEAKLAAEAEKALDFGELLTGLAEDYGTGRRKIAFSERTHYYYMHCRYILTWFVVMSAYMTDQDSYIVSSLGRLIDEISNNVMNGDLAGLLVGAWTMKSEFDETVQEDEAEEFIQETEDYLDEFPGHPLLAEYALGLWAIGYDVVLDEDVPRDKVERAYEILKRFPDNPQILDGFYRLLECSTELDRWADYTRDPRIRESLSRHKRNHYLKPPVRENHFADEPYVRTEKKIYPNDPCPCGSGKKYKKCCGKNK